MGSNGGQGGRETMGEGVMKYHWGGGGHKYGLPVVVLKVSNEGEKDSWMKWQRTCS